MNYVNYYLRRRKSLHIYIQLSLESTESRLNEDLIVN